MYGLKTSRYLDLGQAYPVLSFYSNTATLVTFTTMSSIRYVLFGVTLTYSELLFEL